MCEQNFTMGGVPIDTTGISSNITSLFNNKKFSDIEFLFVNGDSYEDKMYGHKLIIALRSNYFSKLFYEEKTSLHKIEFDVSMKPLFYLLLKFLYTDNVEFKSMKEACGLLGLASKFGIKELELKCQQFLLEGQISIQNIFSEYDYVLSKDSKLLDKNNQMILDNCREFVSKQTDSVFNSICDASGKVIEDIIKLDCLSVSTELDVINAVLEWGKVECKRKNLSADEKYLREFVSPFLKYLRFLTLTDTEFLNFVETNNHFLTPYEAIILTKKILQPFSNINIPENICCSTEKRISIVPVLVTKTSVNFDNKLTKTEELGAAKYSQQNPQPTVNYQVRKVNSLSNVNDSYPPAVSNKKKISDSPLYKPPNFNFFEACSRSFNFPLKKPTSYKNPFGQDLTCTVSFSMRKGNMCLSGFELKFLNPQKESLEFDVSLKGFGKKFFNEVYKGDMQNEIFTVKLPDNMKLMENDTSTLEISVENFPLYHSYMLSVKDRNCEINSGLNCACEISLKSTQKCEGDFFFLINRLLYSTF